MRWLLLSLALVLCEGAKSQEPAPGAREGSQKPQTQTQASKKATTKDERGTRKSPLVVEVLPSEHTHAKTEKEQQHEDDKAFHDALLTYSTIALAVFTLLLFIYTARLWKATVNLGKDAKATSGRQAGEMQNSIAQATRAGTAMEDIAEATKNNALLMQGVMQKQMRAYIAVDIGTPTCQDKSVRFAAAPVMTNTGFTPARNVSHKIKAAILDLSNVPETYQFDESAEMRTSDAVLSPRQTFVLNSAVDSRVPDEEVPGIMKGATKRLFVWGTVTYDDIFGDPWETNFCHNFIFFRETNKEGIYEIRSLGYYHRSHNSAT